MTDQRSFTGSEGAPTWRQSDEAIRNLIAAEIWAYQECVDNFGPFDQVSADGGDMKALAKSMAVDEAERIRKVVLESLVVRARILSDAQRPTDREQVAKIFAYIWHGDAAEWRGFLSKADAFLAYPTHPTQGGDKGGACMGDDAPCDHFKGTGNQCLECTEAMKRHDEARALRAAPQPTTAAYPAWQPIETAPKDGTRFWAFQASKEAEQYICWWKEDFMHWEGWQTVWDDEPEPTHWQSLPTSPMSSTVREGGA